MVALKLEEENGKWRLNTNLYEYLPKFETQVISTEVFRGGI